MLNPAEAQLNGKSRIKYNSTYCPDLHYVRSYLTGQGWETIMLMVAYNNPLWSLGGIKRLPG